MSEIDQIAAVGTLADPLRRALYEYVVDQPEPVGREEAARAVSVPVHKAKFHLDRLVEEGLLDTVFRRLSGKTGPGAGRPSKLYCRSAAEIEVSIPGRRYNLVGGILAGAIERAGETPKLRDALAAVARESGYGNARQRVAAAPSAEHSITEVSEVLAADGYEPIIEGETVRLRNCPFDDLAKDHTDLVCGINHAYVQGVLDGLGCAGTCACLEPSEGYCCVTLRQESSPETAE